MINKIYIDDKGRKIIYNNKTETGYVILPKDEKQYRLYSNRYIISFIIVILFSNFIHNFWIVGLIGILICGSLEYAYRMKFLPSLSRITHIKKGKTISHIDMIIEKSSKKRCLLLSISYAFFAILLLVNILISKTDLTRMIGNLVIGLGAIYLAYANFKAYCRF